MNRGYIVKQTGCRPFKHTDKSGWFMTMEDGTILSSSLYNERKAYEELYDQFWHIRRNEALERDGYKCRACGSQHNLSVDHIHSRSHGGTDDLANLRCLCATCHENRHFYGSGWKLDG